MSAINKFRRSKLQSDFKLQGVPVRFIVKKTRGNPVKKELLRRGHSRRGVGMNEGRGVGPKRNLKTLRQRIQGKPVIKRDVRRRRDSRRRRKTYTSATRY